MVSGRYKQQIKSIYIGFKNKIKKSPLYWRTLIVLLFIALIIKWIIIYFSYKNLNPWGNVVSYLASDIIVLFFAHLLITINYWVKKRSLRLINDFIVFAILVIFLVDIFTIYFFQSRVSVIEAFSFWSNGSSWFSWVVDMRIWIIMIVWMFAFLCMQSFNKTKWKKYERKKMMIFFSICCVCYALFFIIFSISKIDLKELDNIFTINMKKSNDTNLDVIADEENNSDEEKDEYEDYITDIKWEWKDLNIILVFAESLSAIDSENMWWNDNMPNFDRIQKNWITFTNFIANGRSSDTAHIATLLGVMPLANITANSSTYEWYKLIMQPLPEYLNTQWYSTTFISAASLEFLNQREFLSWAWFQKIIWEEEFEKNKKYTFDSAPDEDLYNRVLDEIQTQTWKYFIWLQTISYHKPYNTPYGDTEHLALKYADEELFRFYKILQWIWFFDDWILVIVWDHRKMNPSEKGEDLIFWENWHTRSVATLVWSWIQSWEVNWNIIQHTDFYNSIKRLVWKWFVSVDSMYNDVFLNTINRNRWITKWYLLWHAAWYTVSFWDGTSFSTKNLSNLKNRPWYDYFLSYLSFELWDGAENSNYSSKKDNIVLIWHRWYVTWATPENSLNSFLQAKDVWAKWIEFDVSYTRDKVNIVAHGENLLLSEDCREQKIRDVDLDWINDNCKLRNGEKYRTLKDMLELVDWFFDYYFLEIKVYDEELWAQQTLDAIQTVKDLNMQDRVIFISYSDAAREVLASDPDIIFWWDTFDVNDLDFVWENNSKYFLAPYDMLTTEIVQRAKSLWKEVATYTVNETWDFQAMKDLWIKFVMTDKIDILQEYNSMVHYPIPHNFKKLNLRKSLKIEWSFIQ